MKAKQFEIKVKVEGVQILALEGAGRAKKIEAFKSAAASMSAQGISGEIWMSEVGAKAWSIWSFQAGAAEAHKVGSQLKV